MNRFLTEVELRKSNIKCSNTLCDDKKPNMKLCFINTKEVFRCMNTKCKRYISARHPIFNYNQFSFLPITKVLEIIWLWSNSHSVIYVQQQTRLNKTTIIKWFSKIRKKSTSSNAFGSCYGRQRLQYSNRRIAISR